MEWIKPYISNQMGTIEQENGGIWEQLSIRMGELGSN